MTTHIQPLVGNAAAIGAYFGGARLCQPHTASGEPTFGGQDDDSSMDGTGDYCTIDIKALGAAMTAGTGITLCCSLVEALTGADAAAWGGVKGASATSAVTAWQRDSTKWKCQIRDQAGTKFHDFRADLTAAGLGDGKTHTLVYSSDLVSGTPNGTVVFDGAELSVTEQTQAAHAGFTTSSHDWGIGRNESSQNNYATGRIAHVAVWDRELSVDEMKELHRAMIGQNRIARLSALNRPMGRRTVSRFDG